MEDFLRIIFLQNLTVLSRKYDQSEIFIEEKSKIVTYFTASRMKKMFRF